MQIRQTLLNSLPFPQHTHTFHNAGEKFKKKGGEYDINLLN